MANASWLLLKKILWNHILILCIPHPVVQRCVNSKICHWPSWKQRKKPCRSPWMQPMPGSEAVPCDGKWHQNLDRYSQNHQTLRWLLLDRPLYYQNMQYLILTPNSTLEFHASCRWLNQSNYLIPYPCIKFKTGIWCIVLARYVGLFHDEKRVQTKTCVCRADMWCRHVDT